VYADEFAIGPGTKRLSYGRPDPVVTPAPIGIAKRRLVRRPGGDRVASGLPTRALVAILLVVAAIAAAIILFVIREPGTPAVVPTSIPTAPASVTPPSATPGATAVAVSEECANAFAFAAAHAAEARAPELQQRTLTLCSTTDEWLAAARLHPAAIGVTNASEVGEDDLARLCAGEPGGGVCGLLATPPGASPGASPGSSPGASPGASPATSTAVPSP
jgi:hypothetical protein